MRVADALRVANSNFKYVPRLLPDSDEDVKATPRTPSCERLVDADVEDSAQEPPAARAPGRVRPTRRPKAARAGLRTTRRPSESVLEDGAMLENEPNPQGDVQEHEYEQDSEGGKRRATLVRGCTMPPWFVKTL